MLSSYFSPFFSPIRYHHGLKKMGKSQAQNSVPIHLYFETAKDTIKEDPFDQKELCPCQKKTKIKLLKKEIFINLHREEGSSSDPKGYFLLCLGKETMLHFYHKSGPLLRGHNLCSSQSPTFSRLLF